MPYTNIHWIKLEKRLLNDYRFYSISEEAQLIYVKLLMLAAETNNKIPKNNGLIKSALRSKQSESKVEECLNEIKINFPKFKENKKFYYFKEWANRCNWIVARKRQGNSQGTPKDAVDKIRIDKIRIEYIRLKGWNEKDLMSDDYARIHKAIKTLLLKAKDDNKAIQALQWIAKQGYDWTMETVVKKYHDAIKQPSNDIMVEKGKKEIEKIRQWRKSLDKEP